MKSLKGEQLVLDTGKLVLGFEVGDKFRWTLASGPDRKACLFTKPAANASLWEVELRNPEGEKSTFGEAGAQWQGYLLSEEGTDEVSAIFTWSFNPVEGQTCEVNLGVRVEKGSALSCWNMEVVLPKGWNLLKADFPLISWLPLNKDIVMAAPHGWGLEYSLKPGVKHEGLYPSCLANMQFVAFYNKKGEGLYIGAHDPKACYKIFNLNALDKTAEFRLSNMLAIPNKPARKIKVPYEICIGAFQGGYYEAAMIYREFSFTTIWGKIPTITKRKIAPWLKNIDLWLRPDSDNPENFEWVMKALDYYKETAHALHWYRWHKIPYDTYYPEYFPPKDFFKKQVAAAQKTGTFVMPYINGRLWDPAAKSWKTKKAKEIAVVNEKNECYTEVYGSKVPLHPMCPTTKLWQDTVKGLVQRILKEIKTDGVYIDQIGASWPYVCYNPKHGHLLGGGSYWFEGYRKMLNEIRKVLPKDKIITTEENAECWIDQFDAQLTLNMHAAEGKWIPLYPAVYADRVISFGFLYFPEEDFDKVLPFRVKMQKCLLYGSQLGWVYPASIMREKSVLDAELLKNYSLTRSYAHDFVAGGQFLGLVDVGGKNPKTQGEGKCIFGPMYTIDQKVVEASLWKAENGKLGLILANISDKDCAVTVKLPADKMPARFNKNAKYKTFDAKGYADSGKMADGRLKLTVAARGALVVAIG
jgi:hypothetical protein